MVCTCDCSAGEVETDRQMPGAFYPDSLAELVNSGSGRDSASKHKVGKQLRKMSTIDL